MSDFERRAIAEWQRQNRIYEQARRERFDDVMAACLASMNTITRVLGYEPQPTPQEQP